MRKLLFCCGCYLAVCVPQAGLAQTNQNDKRAAPPVANASTRLAVAATSRPESVDLSALLASARDSARTVPSLLLSERQRVDAVEAFVKIVSIRSPSGEEAAVREELHRMFGLLKAQEIICTAGGAAIPLNLVLEFPATKELKNQPTVILNAHIDTISARHYSPAQMDFDAPTREFFHRQQGSFGADDKAGVTVILSALRKLRSDYWDKGVAHRRVLVTLTAQEEVGCLGAKHLAKNHPQLFENVELTLTSDGPINYDSPSFYPRSSFVVVADQKTADSPPYSRILEGVRDFCLLKKATFALTANGLGQGDFAHFPPPSHAELHLRSPYQNNHRRERVKLDDLFNHIDLFTYILLRLDGVPVQLSQR